LHLFSLHCFKTVKFGDFHLDSLQSGWEFLISWGFADHLGRFVGLSLRSAGKRASIRTDSRN